MPHTLQWIFIVVAIAAVLLSLALFAVALFGEGRRERAELARLKDAFALRAHELRQLAQRRDAEAITPAQYMPEARRIAKQLLADVADGAEGNFSESSRQVLQWGTLLALGVAISAGSAGLYLRYGDYSALDDRAVAQIEAVKTEEVRAKEMSQTMAVLEAAVKKNPDQYEAWEILADQYTMNEDWPRAIEAWKAMARLKPDNVVASVNLLEAMVAADQIDSPEVMPLVERILKLDPHEPKTLVLAGLLNAQAGKYREAVLYWNRLRSQLPEGDEMRAVLDENIDNAMKAGGLKSLPLDTVAPPTPVMMKGMGGTMPASGMPPSGGAMGSFPSMESRPVTPMMPQRK